MRLLITILLLTSCEDAPPWRFEGVRVESDAACAPVDSHGQVESCVWRGAVYTCVIDQRHRRTACALSSPIAPMERP